MFITLSQHQLTQQFSNACSLIPAPKQRQWTETPLTESTRRSPKLRILYCMHIYIHCVSKKDIPPLACYNSDALNGFWYFFGRNVTDKVGNQKTLYYATSINLCFCTTWQNGETWNENHIFHSTGLCYTHNAPVRCLPERKNCRLWCVW